MQRFAELCVNDGWIAVAGFGNRANPACSLVREYLFECGLDLYWLEASAAQLLAPDQAAQAAVSIDQWMDQ